MIQLTRAYSRMRLTQRGSRFSASAASAAISQSSSRSMLVASSSINSKNYSTQNVAAAQQVVSEAATSAPAAAASAAAQGLAYDKGADAAQLAASIKDELSSVDTNTTDAFEQLGNATDSVLDALSPINWFDAALHFVHASSGLPWWASIAIVSFALRACTLPFYVISTQNSVRMMNLKDQFTTYQKKLMNVQLKPEERMQVQREFNNFKKTNNVSQMKLMLPGLNGLLFFLPMFVTLRRMAVNDPTLETGGAMWFSDLSVMDPYYVLPSISALLTLGAIEAGQRLNPSAQSAIPSQFQQYFLWFIRLAVLVMVPLVFAKMPAVLFMYWIPSNLFQIIQVVLMRVNPFKRWLRIPDPVVLNTKQRVLQAQTTSTLEKMLPSFFADKIKAQRLQGLTTSSDGKPLKLYSQGEIASMQNKNAAALNLRGPLPTAAPAASSSAPRATQKKAE